MALQYLFMEFTRSAHEKKVKSDKLCLASQPVRLYGDLLLSPRWDYKINNLIIHNRGNNPTRTACKSQLDQLLQRLLSNPSKIMFHHQFRVLQDHQGANTSLKRVFKNKRTHFNVNNTNKIAQHVNNSGQNGRCTRSTLSVLMTWFCLSFLVQQNTAAWVSDITLSSFTSGSQGQIIWGAVAADKSGICVAGGDLNGDGYGDVIVGSPNNDETGNNAGAAYVLFGHSAPFSTVDLISSSFTPGASTGYKYNGEAAGNVLGTDVAVLGDMNGDGIKDYALVCPLCSSSALSRTQNGKIYVMYGRRYNATFSQLSVSDYSTGSGGFRIIGESSYDSIGTSIASAGDFNKDGRADLLVGAPSKNNYGVVYLIFGRTNANTVGIDLDSSQFVSSGSTGFRINGGGTTTLYSKVGQSVAAAGDVNGDGFDDIVIGAPATDYGVRTGCGAALVIFGRSAESAFGNINLASGITLTMGFRIMGAANYDELGSSVSSMKNMNGDGYADIILGAPNGNSVFGATSQGGSVWVYYGRTTSANVDLSSLNGLGVVFTGLPTGSYLGTAVAGVGDVNGDGLDDFVFTAPGQAVNSAVYVGVAYVIYGKVSAFNSPQDLSSFASGAQGYRVFGAAENAYLGYSVASAGDYNNDGLRDIIVGAHNADANGRLQAGVSYVLLGANTNPTIAPTLSPSATPSAFPSLTPSAAPSVNPTVSPTVNPSANPSISPSVAPSLTPSTPPTIIPTVNPTIKPSLIPSVNPTNAPTLGPTRSLSTLTTNGNGQGFMTFGASANDGASVVNGPGDVNGDGYPDILIGASGAAGGSGVVYVVHGHGATVSYSNINLASFTSSPSTGFTITAAAAGGFGTSVNGLGDVNGDGLNDFIVGAPFTTANNLANAGMAYVFYGKSCSGSCPAVTLEPFTTGAAGFRILGSSAGGNLGASVSRVGDFNGDGRNDIIVGCPNYYYSGYNAGAAFIVFGRTTAATADINIQNWVTGASFGVRVLGDGSAWFGIGMRVSNAGLLNSDNFADVLIGAPGTSFNGCDQCGAALVLFGRGTNYVDVFIESMALTNTTGFTIYGRQDNDGFGSSLSPLLHFDGDSYADIAIGAPQGKDMSGATFAGYVLILYGRTLPKVLDYLDLSIPRPSHAITVSGGTVNIRSGKSIASGDFNGDSYSDLVIGVPSTSGNPGTTYVIFGQAAKRSDMNLLSFSSSAQQGFVLQGTAIGQSGLAVSSLFDFNADGYEDLIVGAPFGTSFSNAAAAGRSYVVYGSAFGVPSATPSTTPSLAPSRTPTAGPTHVMNDLYLTSFAAAGTGFPIYGGGNNYYSGFSVSGGGDLNGDGRADMIIGTKNFAGGIGADSGAVHIVFGKISSPTSPVDLELTAFNTAQSGYFIAGGGIGDQLGTSVKYLGDVNNDTLGDFAVGAPGANAGAGIVYVVYGCTTCTNIYITNNWVTGPRGFRIFGINANDATGATVASAGDFNMDGIRDILVGAPNYAYSGVGSSGAAYVIFGRAGSNPTDINLSSFISSTTTGMRFFGTTSGDVITGVGSVLAGAGDFNGDGYEDIILGMPDSTVSSHSRCGLVAVVFGRASNFYDVVFSTFESTSADGFLVMGGSANVMLGVSVSTLGYFDNDNRKDIAISAGASVDSGTGFVLVLYGRSIFTATINLANTLPNTSGGFYISGFSSSDADSRKVVSNAGDVNGDGIGDLLIGIPLNDGIGLNAGMTYVIYGRTARYASLVLSSFQSTSGTGYRVFAGAAGDRSGHAVSAAGDVNGDGMGDFLIGAYMADPIRTNAGITYVIYGTSNNAAPSAAPTVISTVQPSAGPTNSPTTAPTKSTALDIDLLDFVPGVDGLFYGGTKSFENMGNSASNVGDFNGDGRNDFAFSSYASAVNGMVNVGTVYVLLGQTSTVGYPPLSDLANFTTTPGVGFMLHGTGIFDQFGRTVLGAGDLNGDGLADLAVLSWHNPVEKRGSVYVIYGSTVPVTAAVNISTFRTSSTTGYRIFSVGLTSSPNAFILTARGGDVNGDGLDDLLVSMPGASYSGGTSNGAVWVIYGTRSAPSNIYLQSHTAGLRGFTIFGSPSGNIGASLCASDVDHDGLADIIFTQKSTPISASYVLVAVYGGRNNTDVNMTAFASGNKGFKLIITNAINTANTPTLSRLGDFNGDGVDDVAFGFTGYNYPSRFSAGAVFVYFGSGSRPVTEVDLEAARLSGGATLFAGEAGSNQLSFVGEAGDLNGDGVNDILMSARPASYNGRSASGISYVMYGGPRFNLISLVDLANLASGVDGFRIYGALSSDFIGLSIGNAGDLNRDGVQDFYISSPVINAFGRSDNGGVYVLFGRQALQASKKPSVIPTPMPSRPTCSPTLSPSRVPSVNPTAVPSIVPSANPSMSPSVIPSLSPSLVPTALPSRSPTVSPSINIWVPDTPLSTFGTGPRGQIVWGAVDNDHSGTSVSGGDINGDGYGDVIISAVDNGESVAGAGAVYVLFGHDAPFSTVDLAPTSFVPSATTGLKYKGVAENDRLGRAVVALGDMNGDGVKDYAIGCAFCSSVSPRVSNGCVYVIYGRLYNATFTIQTLTSYTTGVGGFRIFGEADNDRAGSTLAAAGDFNKDGRADLLVGAPDQAGYGYVYLILGNSNANTVNIDLANFTPSSTRGIKISGGNGVIAAFSQIGRSASSAGDVNGDGFDDIVIGAPGTTYSGRSGCGAAAVIFGHNSGTPFVNIDLSQGIAPIVGFYLYGAAANDYFGFSVGVVRNMNGDAYPDFIFGAPNPTVAASGTSRGGSVWVYYGRSTVSNVDMNSLGTLGALFTGLANAARFGYAVAGVGDINGDGLDDFIMSAPSLPYYGFTNVGVVYAIYGRVEAFSTPQDLSSFVSGSQGYRIIGTGQSSYLGYSISSAGDYNKDGLKDIVVGLHNANANGRANAGLTYVLFGVSTIMSDAPSVAPSVSPSLNPTVYPTPGPSVNPSVLPSANPTANPTAIPTATPSINPSAQPSVYPTLTPSENPSLSPSTAPSVPVTPAPTVETVDLYSNSLTPSQGFTILGATDSDNVGTVVTNLGDINGDGLEDLAFSAPSFDVGNLVNAGVVYVLYGNRTRRAADIDLLNFQTGKNGFRILGPAQYSGIGTSIAVIQNFNGDGAKHILIGARTATANGAGAVYAVKAQHYQADVNISSLANQGFSISGEVANDGLGNAVSAGDFNNDGYNDLLLGGYGASRGGVISVGVAYVLLGRASSNPFTNIQLANFVTGSTWGLRIFGVQTLDLLGSTLAAAGDVNNDGFSDVAVAATGALLPSTLNSVGIVFIVFGSNDFSSGDLYTNADFTRDGHGFRLIGAITGGRFGSSLATRVDVNSDGRPDVLVGAVFTPDPSNSGSLYVIYGRSSSELLDDIYMSDLTPTRGYRIKGSMVNARIGTSVAAAGDVNGDGIDDFIVGAPQTTVSHTYSGTAYIIYGTRNEFRSDMNMALPLAKSVGFRLLGTSVNNRVGHTVSAAGDLNGDGFADVITGNFLATSAINFRQSSGTVLVLFGFSNGATRPPTPVPTRQPTIAPSPVPRLMSPTDIDLTYLTPAQGYRIKGAAAGDNLSSAVKKLTDINGDGFDEIMICSTRTPFLGRVQPGVTYVFYGNSTRRTVSDIDLLNFSSGPTGFRIGGPANAQAGNSLGEVRGFFGDNKNDIVLGAFADSTMGNQAGMVYVLRGAAYHSDVDLSDVASAPALRIYGPSADARLGWAVDSAGDFNGDGYSDLLISASGASSSTSVQCGTLYVLFGKVRNAPYGNITLANFVSSPTTGLRIWGAGFTHQLGISLGRLFDLNDDGADDVFASAYTAEGTHGVVYVIFGQFAPTADIFLANFNNTLGYRIVGALTGDRLGISVSATDDVNGDGRPDIILGAFTASRSINQQGMVYVLYSPAPHGSFPDVFLADFVTGTAGFRVLGGGLSHRLGTSVSSAGDVNGDGVPDLLMGAINAAPYPNKLSGIAYVIFGSHTPIGDVYLNDTLPVTSGFRILGEAALGKLGTTVAQAGDVNQDGYSDLLVGAFLSNAVTGRANSGTAYVVYGFSSKPTIAPTLAPVMTPTNSPTAMPSMTPTVASVDIIMQNFVPGEGGMKVLGARTNDWTGYSTCAAGDFDGDGIDDVLVGAPFSELPNSSGTTNTGMAYIVYGSRSTTRAQIDLNSVNFTQVTRFVGRVSNANIGQAVSTAGDVNGDSTRDIIIGGDFVGSPNPYGSIVYVIFGGTNRSAHDVILSSFVSGPRGFKIIAAAVSDQTGISVGGGGDVNGDGYDDVVVGAPSSNPAWRTQAGAVFVVFGHSSATPFVDIYLAAFTTSATTGFRIVGAQAGDLIGSSVKMAGDINSDNFADVVVGSRGSGCAYVIFGSSVPVDVDLGNFVSGTTGFIIIGSYANRTVTDIAANSAGDVNGDGIGDIVVTEAGFSASDQVNSAVYVIYGQEFGFPFATLNMSTAFTSAGAINIGYQVKLQGPSVNLVANAAGDLNSDGIGDLIIGSLTASTINGVNNGIAYVIFGKSDRTAMDLSAPLALSDGFRLLGKTGNAPNFALSVGAAGDFNHDGVVDYMVSSARESLPSRNFAGAVYILYGSGKPTSSPTIAPSLSPTAQPSTTSLIDLRSFPSMPQLGYQIVGEHSADNSGSAVAAAGDLNRDGLKDFLLSATGYDDNSLTNTGIVYVLYGQPANIDSFDLRNFTTGVRGFRIYGNRSGETFGRCVSSAGDFNGDGYPDILASTVQVAGTKSYGVYVFLSPGRTQPAVDLAVHNFTTGVEGFVIYGTLSDGAGISLSRAGDVNHDGVDDIIVGANLAVASIGLPQTGVAYIIFGKRASLFNDIHLSAFASGPIGFRIIGTIQGGGLAYSVGRAGDVNGDGIDDVIVGERSAVVEGLTAAGAAHVIFGHFNATIFTDITVRNYSSGYYIPGFVAYGRTGSSVSGAGDLNGDGIADIIVGTLNAPVGIENSIAGKAHVIFGQRQAYNSLRVINLGTFTAASGAGFCVSGAVGQYLGRSVSSAGDINADGFDDVLILATQGAYGASYVLYGHSTATPFIDIDVTTFVSGPQGFAIMYGQIVVGIGSPLGDVNGDGIDDIVTSFAAANVPGRTTAGISYVIYGRRVHPATTFAPTIQPTKSPTVVPTIQPTHIPTSSPTQRAGDIRLPLGNDGTRGVIVTGRLGYLDGVGTAVSGAGDMDGDGCDEVLIGAPYADNDGVHPNGIVYVLFGNRANTTSSHFDLDSFVTGARGFRIVGYQQHGGDAAQLGYSAGSAGDVNGDGLADVILGAPGFCPAADRVLAGAAFVVFGARNLSTNGDLFLQNLNGYNGFVILGRRAGDQAGFSVASAGGDWNGDGFDDVIIGSPFLASQNVKVGAAWVVFAARITGVFMDIDLFGFDETHGVLIVGPSSTIAWLGYTVAAAGDVNSDGLPDVIVGATMHGAVYVVYGSATGGTVFASTLLDDGTGFKIFDETPGSRLGVAVSGAGDVNNDGIDDMLLGSPYRNPGLVLVLYGRAVGHTPSNLNFTSGTVKPARGFVIVGAHSVSGSDTFGTAVSRGGDINGDGVGDLLLGAQLHSSYGLLANGAVYGLFGNKSMASQSVESSVSSAEGGFRIVGGASNDGIGNAVSSCDFNGDGTPDVLFGAVLSGEETGAAYVIYGTPPSPTLSPTAIPTNYPTLSPSVVPSIDPSTRPTFDPSVSPTNAPSAGPSTDPTNEPTYSPSVHPSISPSVSPSINPSGSPSINPTARPSMGPTVDPTMNPTVDPSVDPSVDPTFNPTMRPSVGPTTDPTNNPTNIPTFSPSGSPSVLPTMNPSIAPSFSPSTVPSVDPTTGPTIGPTRDPSVHPTDSPTLNPTVDPSTNPSTATDPTISPTTFPSIYPSVVSTVYPTIIPSPSPSVNPSETPGMPTTIIHSAPPTETPSFLPTIEPSVRPTAVPTALPSLDPSPALSNIPTVNPTTDLTTNPTANPTAQSSTNPSAQPTLQQSVQPSSQPSRQPTSQPTGGPSRQPSSQPSQQPTSQPSSAPSNVQLTGEWAAEIGNKTALSVVAPVNDVLWACGSSLDDESDAPSCLVANTVTGAVLTRYKFPWDAITSIVSAFTFNNVYLTGRVTTSEVSSNIAMCAVNVVPLTCAVQGFPNINILGASFNDVALKIVYVGLNTVYASATLFDTTSSTAANYVYTNPSMKSITLSRVQSAPSFIGSFVAGTGVRTAGSTNSIVMGWLRADTGQLSAATIVPASGSILNTADLVNAMALESAGPDSFIGGQLQLSDGAGVNAYFVRSNALYRSVVYGARYRSGAAASSRRRRLSSDAVSTDRFATTKMNAMLLVGDAIFMAIEYSHANAGSAVALTSLCVVKALASTGTILKQVLIQGTHNESLSCTDLSSTGLNLNFACSAQYKASPQQSVLLSADQELTFSKLPKGFIRSTATNTLSMEKVQFQASALPVTSTLTNVAATRYTFTDSDHSPSLRPTLAPTLKPSVQPSSAPTGQPSSSPTAAPSVSSQPTSHPSTSGPTNTYKPTAEPTVRPTASPSVTRTVAPSVLPTTAPSMRPTVQPSNKPTAQPSLAPTVYPSRPPIATPTRAPTRSPSRATLSPTRASSLVATSAEEIISETSARDRGDDISLIIGASLGGAVVLMFFMYVARKGYQYSQKKLTRQKILDEYFKRLDLLKENSTDAPVVFPLVMSKRAQKPGGAYINTHTSPTNSAHRRSPTARPGPAVPVKIASSVLEEPAGNSQSDSVSGSFTISSFHSSEQDLARNAHQDEQDQLSPSLYPSSQENALEEGRMGIVAVNGDAVHTADAARSASPAGSDISSGAVSTSTYATNSSLGDDSASSDLNGDTETGSSIGESEDDDAGESDDSSGTKIGQGSNEESQESGAVSQTGSNASVDLLEDDGFEEFIKEMSDEFNSDVSSQDDDST